MLIKLHSLQLHLDYFPKNYGNLSEKQGEHFHQDVRIKEQHYQGQWDVNFLIDYCWCLKQDVVPAKHRRKSLKKTFHPWIASFVYFSVY